MAFLSLAGANIVYKAPVALSNTTVYFQQHEHFTTEGRRDIEFFRQTPGEAVCDMPSLCYWAGKWHRMDVFTPGKESKAGH